jgi:hypothetical protein
VLVRAPRIVRFLSVSRPDTWRVTRTRRPASRRRESPIPSPTPVPPADLAACAGELRDLVDELAELTGCGGAWGMRALRRNVELAVVSPTTLESPDNQLDFIEELAEALWDAADGAVRQAVLPGASPDETGRREERRRALVERLNEITQRLCADAEAWREGTGYPQDDHSSEPCSHTPSPGCAQASV